MNTFKHSGTFGDLIYSLPLVKHLGGGKFYLHLGQINWVGEYFYGATPMAQHRGRMLQEDFDFLAPFMRAQNYITEFEILDPKTTEITHNLDRFRISFVGHPGNYVDIYSVAFGINDPAIKEQLRNTPWLSVNNPITIPGRGVVINRTSRWLPKNTTAAWLRLAQEQGLADRSLFVGTTAEYQAFVNEFPQWNNCQFYPTADALELAQVIAGADQFIGNQSVALSLAIGLGKPYVMEARDDLPLRRNECYFPGLTRGSLLQ